jgi:methylenetetrahydrofolate dehydrogenase (NADP+)/methenyltetrahydrofolate cyclohydrolase
MTQPKIEAMIRMEGSSVAKVRREALRARISSFVSRFGRRPGLAVILVGSDAASEIYTRNKVKTAHELGMESFRCELPASVSQSEVIKKIDELNRDERIDGILLQLPVPGHLQGDSILEAIHPMKDPDALTAHNLGLLFVGRAPIAPCTPSGVMAILDHYGIPLAGRNAVVIGRSPIVGKPMAQLLLQADATVTICHSQTRDLETHTRAADLVVVAAGRPRFLGREAFSSGAVLVDVGIHRPTAGAFAGRICGDVRFEELEGLVSAATPVPGGVGPMTIQMLMENTIRLAELRAGSYSGHFQNDVLS